MSLDRVNDFIQHAELLDSYNTADLTVTPQQSEDVGFRNATFAWSMEDDDGALTPTSRKYRLTIEGELFFKRGVINLIIGPT